MDKNQADRVRQMPAFQPIGGSRPFAGLELKTTLPNVRPLADGHAIASAPKLARKPAEPQKPYGHVLHSQDRNGVYVRIGDRVKNHAEGGVTFVVHMVYTDFCVGVGDTPRVADNGNRVGDWLNVFHSMDCCDCEVIGHYDDLAAELERIADVQMRQRKGGQR